MDTHTYTHTIIDLLPSTMEPATIKYLTKPIEPMHGVSLQVLQF